MDTSPPPGPEPKNLRFLRRLVTVLTATMILGLLTIVGLFVARFTHGPALPVPGEIALPAGLSARAVTFGPGWTAVVTDSDEILIFSAPGGQLRQRVAIAPAPQ